LNFYLIFQDRLVIPDSFLINNDNLVKLFEAPDQGYAKALANGIMVPAVRRNLTSLEELYEQFQQKGDARTSLPYIRTIDSLSKKHRITWDLKDVERQFTEGILHILNSPETLDPNFERLLHKGLKHDIERLYEQNGALHRLDIIKLAKAKYLPLDEKTTKRISRPGCHERTARRT